MKVAVDLVEQFQQSKPAKKLTNTRNWWKGGALPQAKSRRNFFRSRIRKLSNQDPNDPELLVLEAQLKEAQSEFKRLVREAKENFAAQTIYGNQKNPWHAVKRLRAPKKRRPPIRTIADSTRIANEIADKLEAFGATIPVLIPPKPQKRVISFSDWEIEWALRRSRRRTSVGLDRVSTSIMQHIWDFNATTQAEFREILEAITNSIPTELKRALIHPLPKGMNDIRPISLLSVQFNRQFCSSGSSCTTALVQLQHRASMLGERGSYCFLDISKAYDRVNHQILISKASNLLPDRYVSWITDFLRQRTFQVRVNGVLSTPRESKVGIPQGSSVSPFLWKIFINDIPISSQVYLYMDDIRRSLGSPKLRHLLGNKI
eukprot:TRINITY_DN9652_c1_g1_i1.p1 TRINITY_DN9652_c1_g1~~TRINITY_DN9652_c1_g1_i1.p1  ORF type:complete len:374 (+),score=62.20 TRINITY_DN9652_c1_g1_i1:742-1863(+)